MLDQQDITARAGVDSDDWNAHEVAAMDEMKPEARLNTICMYLELPYDRDDVAPKVVRRLLKMWTTSGWLATRDEMMRMTGALS